MFTKYFIVLSVLIFSISASADYVSPREQVGKIGFIGCTNTMNDTLKSFDESPTGEYIIDYNTNESAKTEMRIITAHGVKGDTVLNANIFKKDNKNCWVTVYSVLTFEGKSCTQYKEEQEVWKYRSTVGDIMFTQNKGGVDALFKDFGGGCIVFYNHTKKYPLDNR